MRTIELVEKYRHIFGTDYTATATYAYTVEDGSGATLNDATANNYDATLDDTYSWETSSPPAAYSTYYLDFDGTGFIDLPALSDDISDPMSMVIWISQDSWPNNDAIWYSNPHYLYTYETTSRSIKFFFDYNTVDCVFNTNANAIPTAGTWFHLYWELNNGNIVCYIDGVDIAGGVGWAANQQGTGGLRYDNTADIFGQGDTRQIDGRCDEIAFWNGDTLDSTEINEIMDNGLVGGGTPAAATGFMTTNKGFWG